jgi:hypothetical protein
MQVAMRRAVAILTALVLMGSGLVAGALPAAAGNRATITGVNRDVAVTANFHVLDYSHDVSVWLEHNGTGINLTSAMVSVSGPTGEVVYAQETAFVLDRDRWETTLDLPADLDLGRYLVSFDATVTVQTATGPVDVQLTGADFLEFYQRMSTKLRDFQATPQNIPAGEQVVVSGIALNSSRPLVGEYVQIWFDPKGSQPRVHRGSAKVDDRGYFQKTVTAPSDGTWRAAIPGTDRLIGSASVYATQETRAVSTATHSGAAYASANGYTGGIRIVAKDVVVGLEPVPVYFDAGIVGLGWARSLSNVWFESRRGEGSYPNGALRTAELDWAGPRSDLLIQSTHTTSWVSALMPAGVYDVGVFDQAVAICTGPELVKRNYCVDRDVKVNDRTITTMTVKRASTTSIAASSTSIPGSQMVALRGSVRKVQLVGPTRVENRLAPNTTVQLYFDPAGSRGPVLKKTVRTGSDGSYAWRAWTTTSGRWIAKHPGSSLQAPSQATVGITVN